MAKSEIRGPKEGRIPKPELLENPVAFRVSALGFLSDFGLWSLDFETSLGKVPKI